MNFELFVALRYLKAKRKQTMISIISAISVLGIAAGVMALVIALSLSTGFKEDIQTKIIGAQAHINLLHLDGTPIKRLPELMDRTRRVPHVTGVAPAIINKVYVAAPGGGQNQGAVLVGIDPKSEQEVSQIFQYISEGDPQSINQPADRQQSSDSDSIIIGKQMALTLGGIGSTLQVYFPRSSLTPFGMGSMISSRSFRVAAIFDSGLYDYDSNWIYINIASARRLFSMPDGSASVLQYKTDNADEVQATADQIREAAGPEFLASTWIDLNKALFSALNLEKLILFITIGLIVLVASFNIVTTLIMMVLEKQADIAILTAMGATPKIVMHVFMLQGLVIGLVGTILGTCLGVGLSWILDAYRLIPLEPEIYAIPYVPFHVRFWDVVIVAVTAILISFLATLYPARSASRLNPVEALRYE